MNASPPLPKPTTTRHFTSGAGSRALGAGAVCALSLACACATGNTGAHAREARAAPSAPVPGAPSQPVSSPVANEIARALGPEATFADLVRVARLLATRNALDSRAPCLLAAGSDGGYRLDADLMPALDPLPEPPAELDTALQADGAAIAVLSAWGVLGSTDATTVLSAFSAIAPRRVHADAVALMLTDEGAYLRYGSHPATNQDGPLPLERALSRVRALATPERTQLYVSAEAARPLSSFADMLAGLPQGVPVVLSIVLPSGTRLPASSEPEPIGAAACPDGLPEPAAEQDEGTLDAAAISSVLGALLPDAERCLSRARGPSRAGGSLQLALRIAEDGRTEQACVLGGDLHDRALIACVLDTVRTARFPHPDPRGFVDVHAPLRLTPESWPEQAAYCGPAKTPATR